MAAMGSVLTNKYAEGYPGKRYYGGCQCVDVVENIARERACKLFGAEHANVQPHSGAQANLAVYFALLQAGRYRAGHEPGQRRPPDPRQPRQLLRQELQLSCPTAWTEQRAASTTTQLREHGHGAQAQADRGRRLAPIPAPSTFKTFCARSPTRCGAYLMVDMAHIAGLVAAGVPSQPRALCRRGDHHHPQDPARPPRRHDPLQRGVRQEAIDKAIFPGTQGGPLEHVIAAKAVLLRARRMKPEFKDYQQQIVKNAKALADALMARGVKLVSGGTDNHLMLVDLRETGITGKELEHRLDEVHITANKNTVPNDPQQPFVTSGVRMGTPAVTTRGMGPAETADHRGLHRGLHLRFRGQGGRSHRPRSRAGEEVPTVRRNIGYK